MMLKDRSINVLVLGARAESSLPLIWWKEMLLACDFDDVNIRMVGPELLETRHQTDTHKSVAIEKGKVSIIGCGPNSLSQSSDRTALHLHADLMPLLQWAHVFALFNPGYGSPCSKNDWDPTLRLLLQTHKPVLCTAYGHHDLRRGESQRCPRHCIVTTRTMPSDLSALDRLTAEEDSQELGEPIDFLLPPQDNPFKSYRFLVDEKEPADRGVVITNHTVYAVAAK